jgi:hypothetical protein
MADVPAEYGSWQAAYALFRRWQRDGTWFTAAPPIAGAAATPGRPLELDDAFDVALEFDRPELGYGSGWLPAQSPPAGPA